jgi:RNA-splicing ligase RtcB
VSLENLCCQKINLVRAVRSVGTLGGGNHFIEADRDDDENLYIVIHSGSRHMGLEVAEWYQNEAWNQLNGRRKSDIYAEIKRFKDEGREQEISNHIQEMKEQVRVDIPESLAYVSEELFDDYLNDMKITQLLAVMNRKATIDESPMAYKTMDNIVSNIGPTAKILKVIKPIYNFKAAE